MLRSLLAVLLAASALAATAQTAPRRAAKPATTTAKTKPVPAATSDATATDGGFGNGAPSSSANDGGKGQGVYAAPGMPVDVTSGKEVGSYKGTTDKATPARRTGTTTLSPK
ncbi:hypothetical protein ACFQ48_09195 [Hymenobacter caeli]|uniref:Uncharacterized protein n=1 Tax=Hymenobacter caeli TaxID=2735894 RepID=A0ABX2FN23_9BACT|nr:hypothetical protein [Hymenobacter caeli]NRT18243.1 hypothetical protein [Hymenobacter caeli]